MKNSYRFFENKDCEYYPCHKGAKELNCLFCYCPGHSRFVKQEGKDIKDCSECLFPHKPENYDVILRLLGDISLRL